MKKRYRMTQEFGLAKFNTKNKYSMFGSTLPNENTRGKKLYELLKFMNEDINTRQKYLPKNYLFQV